MTGSKPGGRGLREVASRRGLLCASLLLQTVAAAATEPLYSKNTSPVAGLLGLPSPRSAELTEPGHWAGALHTSLSSHFIAASKPDEALRLDGETLRLALDLRYGFGDNWELQLEAPWLSHRGGKLDKVIDRWHDLWGLPDGGRPDAPRNALAFRYQAPGTQFNLTDSTSGLGDITLAVSRQLLKREQLAVSGTLGHKLATGSERDLLGSGATDTYVSARATWSAGGSIHWHGQAGYLRAGQLSAANGRQQKNLWFGGVGLSWQTGQNWSLLAQLDTHRAPLQSATTALGATSWRLTTGARWRPPTSRWSVDMSIVEDVRVATAPDIIFQVTLKRL